MTSVTPSYNSVTPSYNISDRLYRDFRLLGVQFAKTNMMRVGRRLQKLDRALSPDRRHGLLGELQQPRVRTAE